MKTTRRQSVGPAQQGATQPARNVAFDDEATSKMKGLSLSVVLLAHSANAPAPKVLKMDKITIYKRLHQTLYQFFAISLVLDFASPPLLI